MASGGSGRRCCGAMAIVTVQSGWVGLQYSEHWQWVLDIDQGLVESGRLGTCQGRADGAGGQCGAAAIVAVCVGRYLVRFGEWR